MKRIKRVQIRTIQHYFRDIPDENAKLFVLNVFHVYWFVYNVKNWEAA